MFRTFCIGISHCLPVLQGTCTLRYHGIHMISMRRDSQSATILEHKQSMKDVMNNHTHVRSMTTSFQKIFAYMNCLMNFESIA